LKVVSLPYMIKTDGRKNIFKEKRKEF